LQARIWLLFFTSIYGMILVAITVLNWMGVADRFWLSAFNLYLPQVIWLIPGIILTFFIFKADPSRIWMPLLCVIWVLGPIMGYCWSLKEPKPVSGSLTMRVMTWNIKYDGQNIAPLIGEISRYNPDVVLFQDAVFAMNGPLRDYFKEWHVRSHGQYVIASRYPLSEKKVYQIPSYGEKKETFLRCHLYIGPAVVSLYNVHFNSPRSSLNTFRTVVQHPRYLPEAIQVFDNNVRIRTAQATSVLGYLKKEQGPVLVAGDMNAPDTSLVCAILHNAGLYDCFSEQGRGYGFTYGHLLFKYRLPWLQVSWMRIDHIMVSSGFLTRRCWTGTGLVSDHRPVIADLILKYP
jgi:vancomycin resistance protein VanJ